MANTYSQELKKWIDEQIIKNRFYPTDTLELFEGSINNGKFNMVTADNRKYTFGIVKLGVNDE
jgi:hypothetical protein